jgi:hypothetical protein
MTNSQLVPCGMHQPIVQCISSMIMQPFWSLLLHELPCQTKANLHRNGWLVVFFITSNYKSTTHLNQHISAIVGYLFYIFIIQNHKSLCIRSYSHYLYQERVLLLHSSTLCISLGYTNAVCWYFTTWKNKQKLDVSSEGPSSRVSVVSIISRIGAMLSCDTISRIQIRGTVCTFQCK